MILLNTLNPKAQPKAWFRQNSLKLNGVTPTLVYDFARGRYYRSGVGATGFPFAATRTTNAMMYDSLGRLVWAPANMIVRSEEFNSASWVPTNCTKTLSIADPAGGTSACTVTALAGNAILQQAPSTGVVGQSYTVSLWIRRRTGTGTIQLRAIEGVNTTIPVTDTWTRFSGTAVATTAVLRVGISIVTSGDEVDVAFGQIEPTSIDSPKAYVRTIATAEYGPRFDYDPATLQLAGLLIEAAATNLCLDSQNYASANWTKTNCTLGALTTSPMALTTAQLVTDGAVSTTGLISALATTVASTVHIASVHLKRGNTDWVRVRVLDTTGLIGFQCWINLATGARGTANLVGTGTYQANSFQVTPINNGWYRISLAGTVGVATTMAIQTMTASADASTTNVNGGTYEVWGHQLGAIVTPNVHVPSSYIPTFAATATRAIESCNINTGAWFNGTAGTLYARYYRSADANGYISNPFTATDGTNNNRIQIQGSSTGSVTTIYRSGVGTYDLAATVNTVSLSTHAKVATQYVAVGAKTVLQGGTPSENGAAVVPVGMNVIRLGGTVSASSGKAWLTEFRFYPNDGASNAQLQTLTTP